MLLVVVACCCLSGACAWVVVCAWVVAVALIVGMCALLVDGGGVDCGLLRRCCVAMLICA